MSDSAASVHDFVPTEPVGYDPNENAPCNVCGKTRRHAVHASAATVHVRNKAELQEAFEAWVDQHGYIWFDADLTLAMSLVSYLGIRYFEIDGVRV